MASFLILLVSLVSILSQLSIGCHKSCDVCLSSKDFESGTYRIRDSGKYCLDQDIEFNPSDHWFPTDPVQFPGCHSHREGAYALGFFAAIAIEADDVELDLEGHSISQHETHYLQQRYPFK